MFICHPIQKEKWKVAESEKGTGCSLNIVFFPIFLNIPDSALSLFSLGVSVCTHTRQVENQRYS